jgi:DNA adenine methylase
MREQVPRPFLKWAGGKGQLLDDIDKSMPVKFNRYFEPFLGGGALFFHLFRRGMVKDAFLSDLNQELVLAYKTVRDSVDELINELQNGMYNWDKDTYYRIRAWDRAPEWKTIDDLRRTARMIYLNRTCFNGLYRVNQAGFFNVPFGRYKNPTICDEENLRAVSRALHNTNIQCIDFEQAVKTAQKGDFVYFDPPYQPLSATSNFTDYTAEGFGAEEQKKLAQVFQDLHKRDCLVLESNSSSQFIIGLYSSDNFYIEYVKAKRAISCDPNGRGEVNELLIRNYKDTRQQRFT